MPVLIARQLLLTNASDIFTPSGLFRIPNLETLVTTFSSERLSVIRLSFIDVDYLSMPKYYRKNVMCERVCVGGCSSASVRKRESVCACVGVHTRRFRGWSLKLSTSSL